MNVSLMPETFRAAATGYVESIGVPPVDTAAIDARRRAGARGCAASAPITWRRKLVSVAAGAALLAGAVSAPAVIAQVQRVVEAFTFVNGHAVPLTVDTVSLAQAQNDMPFAVIAPPSILGYSPNAIHELYSKSSRSEGRVVFDYRSARPGAPLTIEESAAAGASAQSYMVVAHDRSAGTQHVAPLPPGPPPRDGELRVQLIGKGGTVQFQPVTWVTRGTRIVLVSPPGLLSADQVNAIRAEMSR